MPLQIYMSESPCTLEQLADNVNDQLKRDGRCLVVVSEGFDVGDLGEVRDSFGHVSFSASQTTVAQLVVNYLNKVGLAAKGEGERECPWYRSTSFHGICIHGRFGRGVIARVRRPRLLAATGEGGNMATILRNPGTVYSVRYDKVPLDQVANSERSFPSSWISQSGMDVTDEFVAYAKPLVGEGMVSLPMIDGRQRLTRFQPIYASQKLTPYVPQADRD